MRAIPSVLCTFLLSLVSTASAQNVMSEREAISRIEQIGNQLCITIPVGVFRTMPPAMMSDQEKALARRALSLEYAGVVTVKSVGNLMENIMTVRLRDDFDKSNLTSNPGRPCLRSGNSFTVTKIIRIESAQGGSSIKWTASVVYALFEVIPNKMAQIYYEKYGSNGAYGKRKGVFLFRQDAFNGQWNLRAVDNGAESDQNFQPNNVAQALRND